MLAAAPEPVPLTRVGYDSGVYAYRADQAPRLKKDMTMLHSSMDVGWNVRLSRTLPTPAEAR
jgi:hypothetical protein